MAGGRRMSIGAQDAGIAIFGNLTAYPDPIKPEPDTAQFEPLSTFYTLPFKERRVLHRTGVF